MKNISTWSINNPIPTTLLFIILVLLGSYAFKNLKVQSFPDIALPIVNVTTTLPGASPEQMEVDVARRLENAFSTIQGLKHTYTKIYRGIAVVTLEFDLEKQLQEAVNDTRDALATVRSDLPVNSSEPLVAASKVTSAPLLAYAVISENMDEEGLSWFVEDKVVKKLLSVEGVGQVTPVGKVSREISVKLDPVKLLSLNISPAEISQQVFLRQKESAAGEITLLGRQQSIRIMAKVSSIEELANMTIVLNDGRTFKLRELASVTDTVAELSSMALLDGQRVVGFEVLAAKGGDSLQIESGVRQKLADLEAEYTNIRFVESFNFVDPTRLNYEGSMSLLLEGALLAILVVWFFLRDFRATLIAAAALPLSIIPTFAFMYWSGFTLNVVTLLSISLIVGVLVDDAIVEIENIARHRQMGKTAHQASIDASYEIGLAVVATSLTMAAVFLPTAFMGGIPGLFFVQFGWTASISVLFSLLVARMLTPMMSAYLLKSEKVLHQPRWLVIYEKWVTSCLNHRFLTLLMAGVFALGGLALVAFLPKGFVPAGDVSQSQIKITLPPGAKLEETVALAEQTRLLITDYPYVETVYTTIGGGSAGRDIWTPSVGGSVNSASLTLKLSPRGERPKLSVIEKELADILAGKISGAKVNVGLAGNTKRYELLLTADNGDLLEEHAKKVEQELRGLEGVGKINSDATLQQPILMVRPDFEKMADLGVSTDAITRTLLVATSGDYERNLTKLDFSLRQIPVSIRLPKEKIDLNLIKRLPVSGLKGPVMLSSVSDVMMESSPMSISRYDRSRNISFTVDVGSKTLDEIKLMVSNLPSIKVMPKGVSQSEVGDAEKMAELFESFSLAMLAGVLCIYMILVLLFSSFVQPATILVALVLSIPGAFLALFIANKALSMPSMIGLIMLMGIATKNSILLVDYAIIAIKQHGLQIKEAILDACQKRARPIIMTTIAMGAGMTPIALGLNTDGSFRSPMAVVVIGGLISSTFLSLLVIPVVFSVTDELVKKLKKLFLAKAGKSE